MLGFALLGGFVFIRKVWSMGWTILKQFIQREKVALTRNDGPENFEDRWAIVTGADGSMGRGYARELASR
jgi:FlaA1/EpsC-like NDP-sugar epimerase